MFWLMDAEMVLETRNNEPELINVRTWRARKGWMEGMTGRTWDYDGMERRVNVYVGHVSISCWNMSG